MLHLGVATLHDCVAAKAFGFGGAVWVDRYHEEGPGAAMFIGGSEDLRVASLAELTEIHRNEMAGAVGWAIVHSLWALAEQLARRPGKC
jgi:hypothetical protein